MSKKRALACSLIFLIMLLSLVGCSAEKKTKSSNKNQSKTNIKVEKPTKYKPTKQDYLDSIGDIRDTLRDLPGVNETLSDREREKMFDRLLSDIKADKLDELAIYYQLKHIVSSIKCSHLQYTYASVKPDEKIIPLKFIWMGDKLTIWNADASNKKYLGCSIDNINGIPVNEFMKRYVTIKSCETKAGEKACIEDRTLIVDDLVYLDIMKPNDNKLKFTIKKQDGTKEEIVVLQCEYRQFEKPYNLLDMEGAPKEIPMSFKVSDASNYANYAYQEDIKNNTMYFQYLSCEEMNEKSMSSVFFEMINKMKKNDKDYKRLVIDVRWNQGGMRNVLQDQLKKYQKYLNHKKIAVITGGNTYSAAAQVVEDLLTMFDHVKIYGGPTGQAIHNYTQIEEYEVGKLGTKFVVPTVKDYLPTLVKRFGDKKISIQPDVEVYQSMEDFMKGIDTVYQAIITDK